MKPDAPKRAVEMTRSWKSQNDFHIRLEISHTTRDSHIPTSPSFLERGGKAKDQNKTPEHRSGVNIWTSVDC